MNGPSGNKGQSRMDHLETKGNQEWTIQKQRAIKNGPPRNKGNNGYTKQRMKTNKATTKTIT